MGRQLRRVPLDFSWPLDKIYEGFVSPTYGRMQCAACAGTGTSPAYRQLAEQWDGETPYVPAHPFPTNHPKIVELACRNIKHNATSADKVVFDANTGLLDLSYESPEVERECARLAAIFNKKMQHHLTQEDVQVLVNAGRLWSLTKELKNGKWQDKEGAGTPSAQEVNDWSMINIGHDSLNQWCVLGARLKKVNLPTNCADCDGEGGVYHTPEDKALAEAWKPTEPPVGEGYQMWEDTSEGSPISPVFASAELLSVWLANNRQDTIDKNTTAAQWFHMITNGAWAPTAIMIDGKFTTGVQACLSSPTLLLPKPTPAAL